MRRGTVGLILLSCAAPRLIAAIAFRHPEATFYSQIAGNVCAGRGYTLDGAAATFVEPFYPAILIAGASIGGTAGMIALQIAIGCAAGLALFAVARRRAGERTAWIALLLYAISPYLARQAAGLMDVTVGTALAIGAVWSVDMAIETRRGLHGAAAGLVLAALVLTRFSFLPIAAGALAIVALRAGPASTSIAAVTMAAAIVPWLLFSRAVSGDALPQRAGQNLFVTTSAWSQGIVPRVNTDVLQPAAHDLAFAALGEQASAGERDRFLLHQAIAYATAHPWAVVRLKLRNLAAVLQPRLVPFTERRGRAVVVNGVVDIPPQAARPLAGELAVGVFQTFLLAGGAAGLWKRRRLLADDAMLGLVLLSIVAVNVTFFPTTRLLAPMTFALMFYAAVSVTR